MEKQDLTKIQIISASSVVFIIILFLISIPIHNKSDKILAEQIQTVLDTHNPNTYVVKDSFNIVHSLSTIGNFYTVETDTKNQAQVCILRIMGIKGPVLAIFLRDDTYTTFIDFLGFRNADTYVNHGITKTQITYWQKTIDEVLTDYFNGEDENNDKA